MLSSRQMKTQKIKKDKIYWLIEDKRIVAFDKLQATAYDIFGFNYKKNLISMKKQVLKTELGKSPQQTITQGTGKRAKTVDNPNFISNTDLGTMIQNRTYPAIEGFIIEPQSTKLWRGVRNWGLRFPIYSTITGISFTPFLRM